LIVDGWNSRKNEPILGVMIRYYDKNTKKIIESLICNQKVSKKETANTINEMIEE